MATLVGTRDALPGDNTKIIDMTKGTGALWTVNSGDWSVVNGKLTSTASWGPGLIWAGNPPLVTKGDLTAGFTLQLSQAGELPLKGGFMFYASTPTIYWDWNMNGYSIEWNGSGGGMDLIRWEQGNPTVLFHSDRLSSPPKQWLLKVEGNTIRFYGDGALLFTVQDAAYRSGYFGFYADYETKIELSNVQIGKQFRTLWGK